MFVNAEPIQHTRADDPSSERWLEYYREARKRRHARGPEVSTRERRRRWRNRQMALAAAGFVLVGILFAICFAVLER